MNLSMLRSMGLVSLLVAIPGCRLDMGPTDNPYQGCYDDSCVSAPVEVRGVPPLTAISTYSSHVCGLAADGEAWCWGSNTLGQLGDGSSEPRSTPVRVAGGHRFSAISVGSLTTCAIALEGTLFCWGSGAGAELGQAAPERCGPSAVGCATSPLALPGRGYLAVAAGVRHVCAIADDRAAYCWGFNFLGETGGSDYGTTTPTPRRVEGGHQFVAVGAGDSYTCALTTAGRAFCWGSGNRLELGRPVGVCNSIAGFSNVCSPVPVASNTAATFRMLSVGNSHVCGLTAEGDALCWGDNGQGQLGTRDYATYAAPVAAQGDSRFTTIDASTAVSCGTRTDGSSVCWGLNLMGKLGTGTRIEISAAPVAITGGHRFTAFAGGRMHVCALTSEGLTYCWGSGREGQLGAGPLLP